MSNDIHVHDIVVVNKVIAQVPLAHGCINQRRYCQVNFKGEVNVYIYFVITSKSIFILDKLVLLN